MEQRGRAKHTIRNNPFFVSPKYLSFDHKVAQILEIAREGRIFFGTGIRALLTVCNPSLFNTTKTSYSAKLEAESLRRWHKMGWKMTLPIFSKRRNSQKQLKGDVLEL